jgi:lysophospholipase L1-like esterase
LSDGPNLLRRSRLLRVGVRALLLLVSSEASLAVAARVYSRRGASGSIAGAIVCLGDSNTFGLGAPRGRSYPDQLRALLEGEGKSTPVVNLGFVGLRAAGAVQRLESALDGGEPAAVVLLAGHNDWIDGKNAFPLEGGERTLPPVARLEGLRRLRTVRMLEAAWHVLRGDVARPEFGGADDELPDAQASALDRRSAYERATAGGARAIVPWLLDAWGREDGTAARRAFEDLASRLGEEKLAAALELPPDCYRFELALLAGDSAPPPRVATDRGVARAYSKFAEGYAALASGRLDDARALLEPLGGEASRSWRGGYVRLHVAWISLLAREWRRAADELDRLAATLVEREPLPRANAAAESTAEPPPSVAPPAERHQLAGQAIARLFADSIYRLAHASPERRARWEQLLREGGHADGNSWLLAAQWLDALKGGEAAAIADCRARASSLVESAPAVTPLSWLVEHPDADFATARESIVLTPPRAAWLGVKTIVFPWIGLDPLRRVTAPAYQRLVELSRQHGFKIVVLTYLDYEKTVPSDCLRAFARDHAYPLVDLEAIYPLEELSADDKRRYFSADRSHPNEAGYALMAKAVLPTIRSLLR